MIGMITSKDSTQVSLEKSNHIFYLSQKYWEKNSKGIKSKLNMEIKESDLDDALIIKHNCIKHGFERYDSLIEQEKLKQALLDRNQYMIKQKDETLRVLDSTWFNSWKAVMLYKNYRQQSLSTKFVHKIVHRL